MDWSIDPHRPIYQQIIHGFKHRIARGELAEGDKILSQRELAEEVRVNPNTVQRAYREMEYMGMVQTLRGQGTYVTVTPEGVAGIRRELAQEALERFIDEMKGLGLSGAEVISMVEEGLKHGVPR